MVIGQLGRAHELDVKSKLLHDVPDFVAVSRNVNRFEQAARTGSLQYMGDHRLAAEIADVLVRNPPRAAAGGNNGDASCHCEIAQPFLISDRLSGPQLNIRSMTDMLGRKSPKRCEYSG